MAKKTKPEFLLSSDTLGGYGLDLIFEVAQEAGFDGVDLAMRKSYDARNQSYVKKVMKKRDFPVKVIQTSASLNQKELDQALDLCEETGADTITINAPKFFDVKAYNFITEVVPKYRKDNEHIHFSIINPSDSNLFALPIPKYRFTNIVEIIKKFGFYLGLDIANMDDTALESDFMRKINNFVPYMSVLYFSDKTKLGEGHVLPGEGALKLTTLLKKFKENEFDNYISVKVSLDKKDLSDTDKVITMMKKARTFLKENYEDVEID